MEVIDPGHLQETIEHFSDESYTDSSRAPSFIIFLFLFLQTFLQFLPPKTRGLLKTNFLQFLPPKIRGLLNTGAPVLTLVEAALLQPTIGHFQNENSIFGRSCNFCFKWGFTLN